jgi:adenylate cyclase
MPTFLRRLATLIFGPPVAARLPERVQAQIARDQADSEILIGWVQLVGVAFFALLYSLARKTFPPEAELEPVPWALAFYFVFTVIRLVLAHMRRLPQWMVVVSIVVDIAALIVTIWSFHIQYMQPPGFSLKGPTMLYLFGLIALRALRFDPRYVAMAGGAAVLGWGALVVYAVAVSPEASGITRDYVRYLTSPDVLIGGEVDKILTLAMVTLVLVIALTRARKQLIRSVAESQAAAELSRFFSPEIARQITASDHMVKPGEGVARDVAILFVDLRGFTALSHRIGATETVELLSHYQAIVVPVVRKHGGSIDKFLGDGVMATFGAAAPSATYARDALAAALEIDAGLRAWNVRRAARGSRPMAWGMGLATGTVVFGAVGDASRLEYTVIGEAVNLAAKLEKHCKASGARLSTTAVALALATAQGLADCGLLPAPATTVDGVSQPLDVCLLKG